MTIYGLFCSCWKLDLGGFAMANFELSLINLNEWFDP